MYFGTHLIHLFLPRRDGFFMSILPVRKLRPRGVKQLVEDHTASKWWRPWVLDPGCELT